MNNTLNLDRFVKLVKKTIMERPVQLLGIMLLTCVVVLMIYALMRQFIGYNGAQNLSFLCGLIFGGGYLSSAVFNYFGSSANGSSFLTLPGSQLEKWLAGFLITWVFFVVIFLLFYKAVDAAFVYSYYSSLDPKDSHYLEQKEGVRFFDLLSSSTVKIYVMFANFTSAMFVGAFYFNRVNFVKTGLVICAVLVGVFLVNLGVANLFFPGVTDAFPFSHVSLRLNDVKPPGDVSIFFKENSEANLDLTAPYSNALSFFTRYILTGILCVASFLKLKEKEF